MDNIRNVLAILLCLLNYTLCNSQPCYVDKAKSQIGVREKGANKGDSVKKYLNSSGLSEGYAWCAAFLNWCLESCNHSGPDKSAWSPSWFTDCVKYRRAKDGELKPGQQFGLYFPHKGRVAHVGIIISVRTNSVKTIEGNTNMSGAREGDGVYEKIRPKRGIYITSQWAYEID